MKYLKNIFLILLAAIIPFFGINTVAFAHKVGYNVTDFGATGDGITDDGAAIQTALDECNKNGGGTVRFPSGVYCISKTVFFCSDQTLLFEDGAVLKRIENAENPSYGCGVFLCNLFSVEDTINNEVACSNVQIIGGTFDGAGAVPENAPINVAMINTCHAENIRISGCTFINNYNAHCIEINSSDNVEIENCTFGKYFGTAENIPYNEMIQIDKCMNAAFGTYYDGASYRSIKGYFTETRVDENSADERPSSNISIHDCLFDCNSYCTAIGNHHSSASTTTNDDISIYGNFFIGGSSDRGYIDFDKHTLNVVINDNVFEDCNSAYSGRSFTAYRNKINGEYDADSIENAVTESTETFAESNIFDIIINFFKNFINWIKTLFGIG